MNDASTPTASRVQITCNRLQGDGNIRHGHPADKATWIWIESPRPDASTVVRWSNTFHVESNAVVRIHISADQRFQCFGDGHALCFGPDRSDLENWKAVTFDWHLERGAHKLEVLCWWLAEPECASNEAASRGISPPMAQVTWKGGFVLAADGKFASTLNTGQGAWEATDLSHAVQYRHPRIPGYHVIGPSFCFNMAKWHCGASDL